MAKFLQLILCITHLSLSLISSFALNPQTSSVTNHQHKKGKQSIGVYELKKGNFSIKLTNYGATVISLILPDKYGKLGDVVLGYERVKEYVNDTTYFGAIVGRVANRIAGAQFTYNGVRYKLVPNEGKNILHGGPKGFSRVCWKVDEYFPETHSPNVTFSYYSVDVEEGFPGNLKVKVTYKIIKENQLSIEMSAKAINKATPVNLASHTYWNLGGHNSGNILKHKVQIFASQITPVDNNLIPTGDFEAVKGTPFDFLQPHTVGSRINQLPGGYDINYVVDNVGKTSVMKPVAIVEEEKSGRVMKLWANKPGVQFYTSNTLSNVTGKGGYVYGPHAALCLETQGFPDAVNQPNFPSVMVGPGDTYEHFMLLKFSTTS
ncbi:hypothetical protein RND81_03G085900 [Saponaria officinalis]|uniref:Aldose 1-epimerase n=1 Tax=Saponaria officinalis TaxID=3572 RepID=A0AAW1M4M9_SAPOF